MFNYHTRERKQSLTHAMDSIRDRFGNQAILKASSLVDGAIAIDRGRKIGGHYQ
jgi:DNA polymerase V